MKKKSSKSKAPTRRKAAKKLKPAAKSNARTKLKLASKAPAPPVSHSRSTWGQVTEIYDSETSANRPRETDAGDSQGLSPKASATFESVEELAEDGQGLEAIALEGIENAPDPDQSEVKVHQAPNKNRPQSFKNRNRL